MKIIHLSIITILIFAVSCKKTQETSSSTPTTSSYQDTTSGSTWSYHQIDSSGTSPVSSDYTLTATSKDTVINTRTYHIYNNSAGGNNYLNISGNDYYEFDSLPSGFGTGTFERLYLIDSAYAGTSWSQTETVSVSGIPFPVPVTISYIIGGRDISMTVNNISYSNVILVTASISSSLLPAGAITSSINNYYAPKYGLIESSTKINLNYSGILANVNLFVSLTGSNLL